MSFNYTNLTGSNITGITSFISTVNTITNSTLIPIFSYVVFVLLFVGMYSRTQSIQKSFLSAGFASVLINSILVVAGLLSTFHVVVAILLMAVGFIRLDG